MKKYFEKRITLFRTPMIIRKRVKKSRGWAIETGGTFRQIHMGKLSLLVQKSKPTRGIWSPTTWMQNNSYDEKAVGRINYALDYERKSF